MENLETLIFSARVSNFEFLEQIKRTRLEIGTWKLKLVRRKVSRDRGAIFVCNKFLFRREIRIESFVSEKYLGLITRKKERRKEIDINQRYRMELNYCELVVQLLEYRATYPIRPSWNQAAADSFPTNFQVLFRKR